MYDMDNIVKCRNFNIMGITFYTSYIFIFYAFDIPLYISHANYLYPKYFSSNVCDTNSNYILPFSIFTKYEKRFVIKFLLFFYFFIDFCSNCACRTAIENNESTHIHNPGFVEY